MLILQKFLLPVYLVVMVLNGDFPTIIPYPFPPEEAPTGNLEFTHFKNPVRPTHRARLQVNNTPQYSSLDTSISTLLQEPEIFHQQLIKTRGFIKQPELHLDDTQLKENFVFRLTKGNQYITVFGTHDRTQGAPFISTDQQVEVVGYFYKERILNSYLLTNLLEALTVNPYPPIEPDRT